MFIACLEIMTRFTYAHSLPDESIRTQPTSTGTYTAHSGCGDHPMNPDRSLTVALLLSCESFESFFGGVLRLDRDKYLKNYRNDFAWYYSMGLIENGVHPILYIPSIQYDGIYETDVGVSVRFLRVASWYRPLSRFRRAMRATRWSLYLSERVNAGAFLRPLNESIAADGVELLYVQEYWGGRFDHLVHRVSVPISAADHGGVAKGVVKWFKRRAFKRAALLYCQTRDECSQVQRYGGRTLLQPNGGDTSFFVPPPKETQRTQNIITVARLTNKQKRTSDLIKAMKLLAPEWTLDIVGTGPDQEMLETLASTIGVAARVTFHGFKSKADVRSMIQHCGVYAMPSSNEAMCLAVLEAMSCGAAVVASRIRSFQSLITDGVNGRLFSVGDVPALAKAIEVAWKQRDTLGPMAVSSVSEQFNSKSLYRQLAQSMRTIAGLHSSVPYSELQPTLGA
jgi:glycosyltransferase involved in cell wall biosynthesis